jgi:hypothetical protein
MRRQSAKDDRDIDANGVPEKMKGSRVVLFAFAAIAAIASARSAGKGDDAASAPTALRLEQFKRAVFSENTKNVYLVTGQRRVVWNMVGEDPSKYIDPIFLVDPFRRTAEYAASGHVLFGYRSQRNPSPELLIIRTRAFDSEVAAARRFIVSKSKNGDRVIEFLRQAPQAGCFHIKIIRGNSVVLQRSVTEVTFDGALPHSLTEGDRSYVQCHASVFQFFVGVENYANLPASELFDFNPDGVSNDTIFAYKKNSWGWVPHFLYALDLRSGESRAEVERKALKAIEDGVK